MPIGISAEHAELASSVRRWAESHGAIAVVRAAETDPAGLGTWGGRAAELGLAAIALPEDVGGGGGSVLDQAVAIEAAAYALVPGPLLTTAAVGLASGDAGLRRAIATGETTVAVAGDRDAVLSAEATHVAVAGVVLPLAEASTTPGASPDLSRATAVLDGTPSGGVPVDAERLRRVLVTLAAAEASGIARWCLDTAVAYAGVREQFGRKIGSFQAVKHLCAEMLETSESVTAAAWDAAVALDDGTDDQVAFAVDVAGAVCLAGAVSVAKSCIQVLGGIGFTFEHDAHLYLRRAMALQAFLGGPAGFAADLTALAARGVRRSVRIDFAGQDEEFRTRAAEEAERVAALAEAERRVALAESGLLAPHWPAPYGVGAGPVQQLVIDEELDRAGVARPDLVIGGWAAPTILAHGTDEQRARFVGPTLRGEIVWCQLFSEPEAGSDLASLRTRAERVSAGSTGEGRSTGGSGWLLTGQKVWTSVADRADWGICLARTDPDAKPHAGITYFVVDMRSAGIDVRPLREITGEALFNEVFLDGVFVPDDCVVGEVNGGWRLARTTLANERVAMAGSKLDDSLELSLDLVDGSGPGAAAALGHQIALAQAVKLLGLRATLRSIAGQGPGAESSVAKLVGVRSRQDSAELAYDLLGAEVLTGSERARRATQRFLNYRCLSIAGGTTQVLRNVAGERILGLPRG